MSKFIFLSRCTKRVHCVPCVLTGRKRCQYNVSKGHNGGTLFFTGHHQKTGVLRKCPIYKPHDFRLSKVAGHNGHNGHRKNKQPEKPEILASEMTL